MSEVTDSVLNLIKTSVNSKDAARKDELKNPLWDSYLPIDPNVHQLAEVYVTALAAMEDSVLERYYADPVGISPCAPELAVNAAVDAADLTFSNVAKLLNTRLKGYVSLYGSDTAGMLDYLNKIVAMLQGIIRISALAVIKGHLREGKTSEAIQKWEGLREQIQLSWRLLAETTQGLPPEEILERHRKQVAALVVASRPEPKEPVPAAPPEAVLENISKALGVPLEDLKKIMSERKADVPPAPPASPGGPDPASGI